MRLDALPAVIKVGVATRVTVGLDVGGLEVSLAVDPQPATRATTSPQIADKRKRWETGGLCSTDRTTLRVGMVRQKDPIYAFGS